MLELFCVTVIRLATTEIKSEATSLCAACPNVHIGHAGAAGSWEYLFSQQSLRRV